MKRKEKNFFLNGAAYGSVADRLIENNMDPNALRPFRGKDGRNYIARVVGMNRHTGQPVYKKFVTNAPATLTVDGWKAFDRAVQKGARTRLRIWRDLVGASSYTIPDGFGVTVLQSQTMSDFGSATISMDPIREGEMDRPLADTVNIPLPVTHADFFWSAREVAVSRRAGMPLDTASAEAAGRRIAEKIEALTLGTLSSYTYGGGTIYGYLNFPGRNTYTMKIPTDVSWTPADTVADFLAIKQILRGDKRFGPFVVYTSPLWDGVLDDDYSATYPGTLRDRLQRIQGFTDIRTVDDMTGYRMVFVEMSGEIARAIIGMRLTTVRWEERGGQSQHYKAMCIYVPQLRTDYDGATGILDATAA
jgi:hypothetical protein